MFHLVYTSHAIIPFSQKELLGLLKQSRAYNMENDITGMLLYLEGKFIQVLEGRKDAVLSLFDKIKKDLRHERVRTIIQGMPEKRVFKKWSMGFKRTSYSEFTKITGFKDIDIFFDEQKSKKNDNLLLVFLEIFYNQNIVDYSEALH